MKNLRILLFLSAVVSSSTATSSLPDLSNKHHDEILPLQWAEERNPEFRHDLPTPEMIVREGYPVEIHQVITDDCYILEMHRIPYGRQSPPIEGVKIAAVYLQHGLLCSSADWVIGIPEKSLGYILADAGYDVWLGNYRGNTYSRDHCDLDPNGNDFWRFSWDHHGEFDIPAMIDAVLNVTGHNKIHYDGHSMGTTSFMVLMNKKPEYANKIIMANLLSPVAYQEHMRSPLRLIAPYVYDIEWVAENLGLGEFLPSGELIDWIAEKVCSDDQLNVICSNILFLIAGFDPAQLNETLLPTIMHHMPAGSSIYTLMQYMQEVLSAGFHAYDHGEDNEAIYGTPDPPPYWIENVTPPVSLYWSQNDWLSDPQDVARIIPLFPNLFDNYEVPYPTWNHLDFIWGIDAFTLLYPQVLANMDRADATRT